MNIYLAGGTSKGSARRIFETGRRLISYFDLAFADRSFYMGYEIVWYIGGKALVGQRRKVDADISGHLDRGRTGKGTDKGQL
jgi:hypothetical protein